MKRMKYVLILYIILCFLCGCQKTGMTGDKKIPWQDTDFAMGTVIRQNIYTSQGEELADEVLSKIKQLEGQISWRIESSPIAAINENAGGEKAIEVEEKIAGWLMACQDVYIQSNKALDITIGPIARLWDIGGEHPKVPSKKEITKLLPLVDENRIQIKENMVRFSTKGGQIDLGAVGKGIACDEIREFLDEKKQEKDMDTINGTFSIGGSILIYGKKPDQSNWKIGIQNPRGKEGENMGAISISQEEKGARFISTSGDYEKYIEQGKKRYHHIMDPKTGYPSDSGLISVTIISESGFLSDALSTACFVAGLEQGKLLAEKYGVQAIFIDQNKNVYTAGGAEQNLTILEKEYVLRNETK